MIIKKRGLIKKFRTSGKFTNEEIQLIEEVVERKKTPLEHLESTLTKIEHENHKLGFIAIRELKLEGEIIKEIKKVIPEMTLGSSKNLEKTQRFIKREKTKSLKGFEHLNKIEKIKLSELKEERNREIQESYLIIRKFYEIREEFQKFQKILENQTEIINSEKEKIEQLKGALYRKNAMDLAFKIFHDTKTLIETYHKEYNFYGFIRRLEKAEKIRILRMYRGLKLGSMFRNLSYNFLKVNNDIEGKIGFTKSILTDLENFEKKLGHREDIVGMAKKIDQEYADFETLHTEVSNIDKSISSLIEQIEGDVKIGLSEEKEKYYIGEIKRKESEIKNLAKKTKDKIKVFNPIGRDYMEFHEKLLKEYNTGRK